MPQLHINNSFEEQQKKSYSKQLARGLALLKQAVSDNYKTTQGTVNQSIRLGLAASVGLGGAYVAASKLAAKVKTIAKGIHAITNFSGDSNDVEEENVFSHTEQTKQPGFWGIAGLAKYGFKHIVKAIKKNKRQEEKDKKSFFRKLLDGLKTLVKSKWFWLSVLGGIVTAGLWSLFKYIKDKEELQEIQKEALQNSTPIEDPDFLDDAQEDLYFEEFKEVLDGIHQSSEPIKRKWKQDLQQLVHKVDNETNMSPIPQPTNSSPVGDTFYKSAPVATTTSTPGNHVFQYAPLPYGSFQISSRFGLRDISSQNKHASRQHKGIDLAAKVGTPVLAPGAGIVTKVGYGQKAGNYIKIKHDNGYETVYAHLNSTNVKENQRVSGGEMIGQVGNTGLASTGSHLHFGLKKDGQFINPESVVQQKTSLPSGTHAFNPEMSSNIQDSTGLSQAVSDSQQQLIQCYNAFDEALRYNLEHPAYFMTVKKYGAGSLAAQGVKNFDQYNQWADRNEAVNTLVTSLVPGGAVLNGARKFLY